MQLLRIGEPGTERPVARDGDRDYDLSALIGDITPEFFRDGGIARVREALAAGTLPEVPRDPAARTGSPVVRPAAVLGVGLNYASHVAESRETVPENPVLFLRHPNSIAGPDDDFVLPPGSTQIDWEVELAFVLGRRVSQLASPAEAEGAIAGYLLANDISARDFQFEGSARQWAKGKSMPGSLPLGPFFVPADEFDPFDVRLTAHVNGDVRQDSTTRHMIFSPAQIVWNLSQYLALEAGDVVLSGTPDGVAYSGLFPYLGEGDVVDLAIDGLGAQRQLIVSASRRAERPPSLLDQGRS